jgi:hypothetical protein
MPLNLDSLAEVYRAKTDEELRILASDSNSLVEEARGVLANEIRLRNLTSQPPTVDTAEVVSDSSSSKTNFVSSVLRSLPLLAFPANTSSLVGPLYGIEEPWHTVFGAFEN